MFGDVEETFDGVVREGSTGRHRECRRVDEWLVKLYRGSRTRNDGVRNGKSNVNMGTTY